MTAAERSRQLTEKLDRMKREEDRLRAAGAVHIGGVDEVGRGPLAGPVVAACVVLPANFAVLGVDDSKKIAEGRREILCEEILREALAWGVGSVDNERIDRINILRATKEAMCQAVFAAETMLGHPLDHVLIDALTLENLDRPQSGIIKGDAQCLSIAAASILAKVTRDREMRAYDVQYPGYGFAQNKGYGTRAHYEALRRLGLTPIHRRTFLTRLLAEGEVCGTLKPADGQPGAADADGR